MTNHIQAPAILSACLLLWLTACSEPAEAPEPAPDATASVEAEQVTIATPDPAPAPAPAALLTEEGYGGIAINAAAAGTALDFADQEASDECAYGRLAGHDNVYFMVIGGKVARIDIEDPADRLPSGLGIGSTGGDILAVYPTAEIGPHKYVDDAHYYEVALDSGLGLVFEETEGRVTSFRLGRFPEVSWVEGCA